MTSSLTNVKLHHLNPISHVQQACPRHRRRVARLKQTVHHDSKPQRAFICARLKALKDAIQYFGRLRILFGIMESSMFTSPVVYDGGGRRQSAIKSPPTLFRVKLKRRNALKLHPGVRPVNSGHMPIRSQLRSRSPHFGGSQLQAQS